MGRKPRAVPLRETSFYESWVKYAKFSHPILTISTNAGAFFEAF